MTWDQSGEKLADHGQFSEWLGALGGAASVLMGPVTASLLRLDLPIFPRQDRSLELWARNLEEVFAAWRKGNLWQVGHQELNSLKAVGVSRVPAMYPEKSLCVFFPFFWGSYFFDTPQAGYWCIINFSWVAH